MSRQQVTTPGIKDANVTGPKLAVPLTIGGQTTVLGPFEQPTIATPASPPAGRMRLYPKADGNFYMLNSAGVESTLGGEIGPMGPAGPQGEQGIQGVQGPQGDTGLQGIQGPPGIPGQTGAQGIQGPAGPAGVAGPPGEQGNQGIQGPQGPVGMTGIQGPPGVDGAIGPPGPQGTAGAAGAQGAAGAPGAQGVPGPTGAEGPAGPPGIGLTMKGTVPTYAQLPPQPQPANDAYTTEDTGHVWTSNGTAWVDTGLLRGPQGPPGPQGLIGPTGATGPQGTTGQTGLQGVQGPVGPQGATGEQGPAGDPFGTPSLAIGVIVHWRPPRSTYDRYGVCKPAIVTEVPNLGAGLVNAVVLGSQGSPVLLYDHLPQGVVEGQWHFIADCPYPMGLTNGARAYARTFATLVGAGT